MCSKIKVFKSLCKETQDLKNGIWEFKLFKLFVKKHFKNWKF
jgi:hypothetical protein